MEGAINKGRIFHRTYEINYLKIILMTKNAPKMPIGYKTEVKNLFESGSKLNLFF